MDSYAAQRCVAARPGALSEAIDALMRELWPARTRVVVRTGCSSVTYAVSGAADQPAGDAWLTWQLTPERDGTLVRLVLDELDRGPDPAAELAVILDLLAARVAVAQPDPNS
jgi:hypothetical protein